MAIADVEADRARALEDLIREAGGEEAVYMPCDVTREEQVAKSIDETAKLFGGLQIVVNCAGIVHVKPLHEYTAEEWDHLMAVNVRSMFFSIKHALPHLRANRKSYMVNVGSISSFVGQSLTPAYTASKGAVLSLSQSIALDYADLGLRCNCVCPGITDTPMLRHHLHAAADPAGTLAKRLARVPIGRALTPRDIARRHFVFLLRRLGRRHGDVAHRRRRLPRGGRMASRQRDSSGRPVMNLKLACADFTFPLLTHEQSLRLIGMLGFGGVDIGLFEGRSHLWPSREFPQVEKSAAALKRLAADCNLAIADVFLQMAPDFVPYAINQPDADRRRLARDWFVKTLEYASACSCKHVTILPGVHFEEESADDSFARAVEELSWRVEQAKKSGITLGTEACRDLWPRSGRRRPVGTKRSRFDADARLHALHAAGLPDAAIEPLLAHASHFHVRGRGPAGCRRRSRTTSSIIVASSSVSKRPGTAVGSASNMSGSTGSTATSATTCRRRSSFATSCGP